MSLLNPLLYVWGAMIGCILLQDRNQADILLCYSVESLKNVEYSPNVTTVVVEKSSYKRTLRKSYFDNLPNIQDLKFDLSINGIEDEALHKLENLMKFEIVGGDLPIIKATYFNNPHLSSLILSKSNIQDIEEGAFSKLPNIEEIWMSDNSISIIRRGVFENTNFKLISLESNKIETIQDGAFFNMKRLKFIELTSNLLKKFDSTKLINKSFMFNNLQLADNKITEINKNTISTLPNLQYFNVSKNEIETIESGSFYDFQHLFTLDLSRNKIKELKSDVINNNNNLTHLFLHNNDLGCISDDLLMKIPNLNRITIIGNPWQCTCQNDLISYMKKHDVDDYCADIDELSSSSNDYIRECKYNLEISRNTDDYVKNIKINNCYSYPSYMHALFDWSN